MPPRRGGSAKQRSAKETPPKKRKAVGGLLGAPLYDSSDDEDYAPAGSAAPSSRSRPPRQAAAAAAAARQERAAERLDGDESGSSSNSSSDGSGETLGQRRQRLLDQQQQQQRRPAPAPPAPAAPARAAAPPTSSSRAAATAPVNVLSRIFALACAHGALPTACRIARTCHAWRDALHATPEAWRVMDVRGRQSKSVDAWLQKQAASGRWHALESLTIGQAARAGGGDDDDDDNEEEEALAQGKQDAGTSGDALAAFARHCRALRRLTVSGGPSMHARVLEAAMLDMPALEELRLREVRIQPLSGLDKALQALLAAAAGGRRPLQVLEARRCPMLGNKTVGAPGGLSGFCGWGVVVGRCCALAFD